MMHTYIYLRMYVYASINVRMIIFVSVCNVQVVCIIEDTSEMQKEGTENNSLTQ